MNGRNCTLALVAARPAAAGCSGITCNPRPCRPGWPRATVAWKPQRWDVATKLAGRLREVNAWEGDQVKADQVLARLDADDPRGPQLRSAQAQASEAHVSIGEARENVRSAASQLQLAQATLARSESLVQGLLSPGTSWIRPDQGVQTAQASLEAAQARVDEAAHAAEAAQAKKRQRSGDGKRHGYQGAPAMAGCSYRFGGNPERCWCGRQGASPCWTCPTCT